MIKIVEPVGFCHGVTWTLAQVDVVRSRYPDRTVALFHAPVHNGPVTRRLLSDSRVKIVAELTPPPEPAALIFPAHGTTEELKAEAKKAGYDPVIDACCPLLAFRNRELDRYRERGFQMIFIGDPNHLETEVAAAAWPTALFPDPDSESPVDIADPEKTVLVFQSTFGYERFKALAKLYRAAYPELTVVPLCPQCRRRYRRLETLRPQPDDLIVVVGDPTSANSTALYQKAARVFPGRAYMASDVAALANLSLPETVKGDIYLASGTSASIIEVEEIRLWLSRRYTS